MDSTRPPFIGMRDEESFARRTMKNRFPLIIGGVMAGRLETDPTKAALAALLDEVENGRVADPFAGGLAWAQDAASKAFPAPRFDPDLFSPEERAAWSEEIAPRSGLPWRETPFYFIEAYMYLRILVASGYYDPESPHFMADPFRASKTGELSRFLASREMAAAAESFLAGAPASDPGKVLEGAVLFMLKGNRIDLSNAGIAERGRRMIHGRDRDDLLVDQVDLLVRRIGEARRVDIVLDNAGAELTADLVFAWLYLRISPAGQVVLHAKRAPMFVSDATVRDVEETIRALKNTPACRDIGAGLEDYIASGRLLLRDHFFWNGPLHFPDLPADIRADLAESDLTIFKGDANFRRLIEDRAWPYDTALERLVSWFPGSLAVLRTLKSEVAADIPPELSERLFAEDPDWLTDGRWGVVRVVPAGIKITEKECSPWTEF